MMNRWHWSRYLGVLAAVLWLDHASLQGQSVSISEFMAANSGVLRDEDGDSSDWIELFNSSTNAVELAGWSLSDNPGGLRQWIFPAYRLEPQSFLVVFASGKNRQNAAGRLHTNFKLEAGGEFLALTLPDGVTFASIFWPAYPPQTNNLSYGYRMEGGTVLTNTAVYLAPTPGAANLVDGFRGIAEEVQFSRPSGTFVEPFTLTLGSYNSNAVIHYLLLSSMPFGTSTLTNQPTTNSPRYSGPIQITNSVEIRARAFETDKAPGPAATVCFIRISPELADFSSDLPVVVVNTFGGSIPRDAERVGQMLVFEPGESRTSLSSQPVLQTRVGLSALGSSTEQSPKPRWSLELWDDQGNERALPLLNLPPDSDWVLYAINEYDPGLMHNAIFHWFGRQLGHYSSRTRYVEVFRKTDLGMLTTNDYFGLYLILEKPKVSPARLSISELRPSQTDPPDITGGYFLKLDRQDGDEVSFSLASISTPFGTVGGQAPIFVSPKLSSTDANDPRRVTQRRWIQDHLNAFLNRLTSANWTNPVSGYRAFIDVPSWIDNLIVNMVCFQVDSYRLNAFFFKDRSKRLELGPSWDCDRCLGTGGGANAPRPDNRPWNPRIWRTYSADLGNDQGTDFFGRSNIGVNWFNLLFRDPDFWQDFIDRYQGARQNMLSNQAVLDIVEAFYQEIKEAQVREQNRWAEREALVWPRVGRNSVTTSTSSDSNTYSSTYSFDFGPTNLLATASKPFGYFTNEVNFQKQWLLDRLDFIDTNFLSMAKLSRTPGPTPDGAIVTLEPAAKPGTTLYYTLNGVDPRLPGGAISPSALSNDGPVQLTLTNNVRLFVRCFNPNHANLTNAIPVGNPPINSFWSGPVDALYVVDTPPLRLTEIMYHPAGGDAFEFLELQNISSNSLNLAGFHLEGVAPFAFPEMPLEAGQACVVVRDRVSFQARYGTNPLIAGVLTIILPNNEGRLILTGPLGESIQDCTYHDDWYPLTDGAGFSLVCAGQAGYLTNWNTAVAWRPSGVEDGTPGQPDPGPLPPLRPVLVNELLSNPEPPFEDAIELFNPNSTEVDISFWYLTDDFTQPKKFRLPAGMLIPPFGYRSFDEHAFNPFSDPPLPNSFSFRREGDEAYLFSADSTGRLTGFWHGSKFGAAEPNATFGRYVTSLGTEHFVRQIARTFGETNEGPKIGPVVISEIQYRPPERFGDGRWQDNTRYEFIELHNITDRPVALFQSNHPASTWRLTGSIKYQFGPGLTLPPGAYVLIVGFDPGSQPAWLASFRTAYAVPNECLIVGPYRESLPNASGVVEICQPMPGGTNLLSLDWPCFVVDRVQYSNSAPWPATADGLGPSLQRLHESSYGDDPINWTAASPAAGRAHPSTGLPPIIMRPPADVVGILGQRVELSVEARGNSPLSFQWRFNGAAIAGASAQTLILGPLRTNQAGLYTVLVFDAAGAIESAPARLSIVQGVSIHAHPRSVNLRGSTNAMDYGFTTNSATFDVLATSTTPVRFQWRFNGAPISHQNGPTLTVPNVGLAEGGDYDVLVADDISSLLSKPARLTVLVTPTFLIAPMDQAVPSNGTFTVTAVIRGNPAVFGVQWREISTIRAEIPSASVTNIFSYGPITNPATREWRLVVFNAANPITGSLARFKVTALTDADQDGLPDSWESQFGLNAAEPADRHADSDGDGLTNYEEYIAGTDPTDKLSYLRIDQLITPGNACLEIGALSNKSYTIQYVDRIGLYPWQTLTHIPARETNHTVTILDPAWTSQRFYQLVTPARR